MRKIGLFVLAAVSLAAVEARAAEKGKPKAVAKEGAESREQYIHDCLDGDKEIVALTKKAESSCATSCRTAHRELLDQSLATHEWCVETCQKAIRDAASSTCPPVGEVDHDSCMKTSEETVQSCPQSCRQGEDKAGVEAVTECKKSMRDCLERCPSTAAK